MTAKPTTAPTAHRSSLTGAARKLRRTMTDAERKLWARLRGSQIEGLKFRRQQPIGHYVVDFCCLDPKLVVEVDGGQHAAHAEKDAARTEFLERSGYTVLRFWNHDVLCDTDAVVERIWIALRLSGDRMRDDTE
jgi:very-short-patch-repair endonuclease